MRTSIILSFLFAVGATNAAHAAEFISIGATTSEQRTQIINLGVSIEETYSDRVWALAEPKFIQKLQANGFKILTRASDEVFFRAEKFLGQFPKGDERFHTYDRMIAALQALHQANADTTELVSIGKSLEGRDLLAIHLNNNKASFNHGQSNKPGTLFMGNHHAREHLSAEVPLMLAEYLLKNKADPKIAKLLDTRDIWILPMVNPDGAEYDIGTKDYQMWRKNRRKNSDGSMGVDLNRNYDFSFGTAGASSDPEGETYHGPSAFSEPETLAIRNFVDSHANLKTLLSFHTYSELILYPWGYTNRSIDKKDDRKTFETMAKTMSKWNHYKPETSSALYLVSGETTDWAYGKHGIFGFTFELTPKSAFGGGFYPGAGVIDSTFQANLNPCLYLIDLSDDPHRAITQGAGASIWYK